MISAEIERCAGIDVGKEQLDVHVMVGPLAGEPRCEYRQFGTVNAELQRLRQWLEAAGVTHVVMESTGSYWKPVFNVLEDGFQVYLANPHEVKNRKGHKTDKQDSWWLAHLAAACDDSAQLRAAARLARTARFDASAAEDDRDRDERAQPRG